MHVFKKFDGKAAAPERLVISSSSGNEVGVDSGVGILVRSDWVENVVQVERLNEDS